MMPGPVKGGSTNYHQRDLCMQLWQLRTNFTLCDVALKVGGALLPAHRIVLCACSPFFLVRFAVLNQPMDYYLDLTTEGVSYDTCQSVLEYMYTGVVPSLPKKRLPELDWLVEHWQLTSLQTKLASKYKNKRGTSIRKALMVSTISKQGENRGKALAVSTINPSNHDHPYFKDVYKGKNVEPGESLLKSDILNSAEPLPISDELVEEEFCECDCKQETHDNEHDECQANSDMSSVSGTSGNKIVVKEETDFEELLFGSKTPSPAIQFQVLSTDYQDPTGLENEIYKSLTSSDTRKEDVKVTSCIENGPARGIGVSEAQSDESENHPDEGRDHLACSLLQPQDLHLDCDTQFQLCTTGPQDPPDEENENDKILTNSNTNKEVANIMLYMEESLSQGISGGKTPNAGHDDHSKRRSSQYNERPLTYFQLFDGTLFQMYQDSTTLKNGKFLIDYDATKAYSNTFSSTDIVNCPPQDIGGSKVQNIEPDDHQGESTFSKEDTEPIFCTENGPPQSISGHNAQNVVQGPETELFSFTDDLQEERSRHFDENLQRQHFQLDGLPELEDIHVNENLLVNAIGYGGELEVCNTGLNEQPKLQTDAAMQYTVGEEGKLENMNKHKDPPTEGNGQEISTAKAQQSNSKHGLHDTKFVPPSLAEQAELPNIGVFLQPQFGKDKVHDAQVAQSLPFITPEVLSTDEQNCEPVQFSQAVKTIEDQNPKVVLSSQPKETEFQSRNMLQRTQGDKSTLVLLKIVHKSQTEKPTMQNEYDVQYVLAKDTGLRQSGAIRQLEAQTAKHLSHGVVQHSHEAVSIPQYGIPFHPMQAENSKLQKANALQYTLNHRVMGTELSIEEATQRLQTEKRMQKDLQHWPAECTEKDLDVETSEQLSAILGEYPIASQAEAHSSETFHSQAEKKIQCMREVVLALIGEYDQEKTADISFPLHETNKEADQSLPEGNNKTMRMLQTKKIPYMEHSPAEIPKKLNVGLVSQTKPEEKIYTLKRSLNERKTQCIHKVILTPLSEDREKSINISCQQQKRLDTKQAESAPAEKEMSNINAFHNEQAEMVRQQYSTVAQCLPAMAPKLQKWGLSQVFAAKETAAQHRGSSPHIQPDKMASPTCRVTQYLPDVKVNNGKEMPKEKTVVQKMKIDQIGERLLTDLQNRRVLQHLQYEENKLFGNETGQVSLAEKTNDTKSETGQHAAAGNAKWQGLPPTSHSTGVFVQQQHGSKKQQGTVVKHGLLKKMKLQSHHLQPAKKLKLQNDEECQISSVSKVNDGKMVVSKIVTEVQHQNSLQKLQRHNIVFNETVNSSQLETGNKPEPGKKMVATEHLQTEMTKRPSANMVQDLPMTNCKTSELVQQPQHVTKKQSRVVERLLMKCLLMKKESLLMKKMEHQALHLQAGPKLKLQKDKVKMSSVEKVKVESDQQVQQLPTVKAKNYSISKTENYNVSSNPEPPTVNMENYNMSTNPESHTVKVKACNMSNNPEPPSMKVKAHNMSNNPEPRSMKVKAHNMSNNTEPPSVKVKACNMSNNPKPPSMKVKAHNMSNNPEPPSVKVKACNMSNNPEPPSVKVKAHNMSNNPEQTVKARDYNLGNNSEPPTVKAKDNMSNNPAPPTVKMKDYSMSKSLEPATVKVKGYSMSDKPEPPTVKMKDYSRSKNPKPPTVNTKDTSVRNKRKPPTLKMKDYNMGKNHEPPSVKTKSYNTSENLKPPTVKKKDNDMSNNPEPPTVKSMQKEHYICTDCLMLFEDQAMLTVHRDCFHKKPEQCTCDICNLSFDTLTELQTHDTEHHWREGVEIGLNFSTESALQAQNTEWHQQGDLSSSARYALNKQVHEYSRQEGRRNPVSYYCEHPRCTYKTHNMKILSKHRQLHRVIPAKKHILVSCEECGKSYLNARFLAKHKEQNHKQVKLVAKERSRCTLCTYSSLSRSNLAEHLWKKHDLAKEGRTRYKCAFCGFKTLQLAIYKIHEITHKPGQEKPVVCKVCGRRYHKASGLKKHMTYHTGDAKLYRCPHCDYVAVNNKTTLQTHIQLMHEYKGEKRFPCSECEYACNYKGNLYKHLRQVHKKNPCLQGQSQKTTKKNTKLSLLQENVQKTKKNTKLSLQQENAHKTKERENTK